MSAETIEATVAISQKPPVTKTAPDNRTTVNVVTDESEFIKRLRQLEAQPLVTSGEIDMELRGGAEIPAWFDIQKFCAGWLNPLTEPNIRLWTPVSRAHIKDVCKEGTPREVCERDLDPNGFVSLTNEGGTLVLFAMTRERYMKYRSLQMEPVNGMIQSVYDDVRSVPGIKAPMTIKTTVPKDDEK